MRDVRVNKIDNDNESKKEENYISARIARKKMGVSETATE